MADKNTTTTSPAEPTAEEVMSRLYEQKLVEYKALQAKSAVLHYQLLAKGKALTIIGADIGKYPDLANIEAMAKKAVRKAIEEAKAKQ